MSDQLIGIASASATLFVIAALIAAAVVRSMRARRRGEGARAAAREGFGPIAESAAVQSRAFGWTPASPSPTAPLAVDDRDDEEGER